MAIKALPIASTQDYICKDDDPDNPTVWRISPLDALQQVDIRSQAFADMGIDAATLGRIVGTDGEFKDTPEAGRLKAGYIEKQMINTFRCGVRSVKNLLKPDGKKMRLARRSQMFLGRTQTVVDEEFVKSIPTNIINEVGSAILDMGEVTDDQKKGSSESSSPPTKN